MAWREGSSASMTDTTASDTCAFGWPVEGGLEGMQGGSRRRWRWCYCVVCCVVLLCSVLALGCVGGLKEAL
jgi:hypothetical protein